ncbi:MAG TPA: proline--tRNA ligase [Oligoflexia bacterium]|nr:proline--tRNA ligase [Oligoflexia bacterium]HMR25576.1 proline--tRNA ligase [Oligoflexia bacterium]
MKFSQFFCPTQKEVPAEAEIVSHQLMLRAGMIRQLAAGIYDVLPLGLKVFRKVEQLVREEMNAAGAMEVSLPAIHPKELWEESGRWESTGKELLRIKDRKDRDYCFAPTHEEAITDLVRREIQSYKQLPVNLYQIQTKFRDEVRPRFGVMRSREFTMKDAYSFDVSSEAADESYQKMFKAYQNIFTRCGVRFKAVEADSGNIGGQLSQEFMVMAQTGEDAVLVCSNCDYAANSEKADAFIDQTVNNPNKIEQKKIHTPDMKKTKEVADFLNIELNTVLKTLIVEVDSKFYAVVLPGDRELNEIALLRYLKGQHMRLPEEEKVKQLVGVYPGSIGPQNLKTEQLAAVIVDKFIVKDQAYTSGANEQGYHTSGVVAGQDFNLDHHVLLSEVKAGDACPKCKNPINIERGIEVGHVFKLGTKYSESLGANFLDEDGKQKPMVMGCYGIGIARTAAAAIEQNHDEYGIVWPKALAPFDIYLISTDSKPGQVQDTADTLYEQLKSLGYDVLYDDRKMGAGGKFKDADLLGIPVQITVGAKALAEGKVEIKQRTEQEKKLINPDQLKDVLQGIFKTA